ncbi:unnamed protein product [Allacma fusca]|uniref:Uncharacterized protein n=1 Tax=Allacma fusca TaxID=39272 RepID=A0A8J2PCH3_9HEXA|nr:unnamed protein product [Allacma fusca]
MTFCLHKPQRHVENAVGHLEARMFAPPPPIPSLHHRHDHGYPEARIAEEADPHACIASATAAPTTHTPAITDRTTLPRLPPLQHRPNHHPPTPFTTAGAVTTIPLSTVSPTTAVTPSNASAATINPARSTTPTARSPAQQQECFITDGNDKDGERTDTREFLQPKSEPCSTCWRPLILWNDIVDSGEGCEKLWTSIWSQYLAFKRKLKGHTGQAAGNKPYFRLEKAMQAFNDKFYQESTYTNDERTSHDEEHDNLSPQVIQSVTVEDGEITIVDFPSVPSSTTQPETIKTDITTPPESVPAPIPLLKSRSHDKKRKDLLFLQEICAEETFHLESLRSFLSRSRGKMKVKRCAQDE